MYRPQEITHSSAGAAAEPAELELEHLEAQVCELASHVEAGMARWIALVGEYDHREGWGSWRGVRSTAEWIAWRCSCSPRMAREHVRVARALRELPLAREAFGRGELSYSKVRSLTRVATADSEEFLLHQATYATAAQLDRMLGAYRRSTGESNIAHEERELSWSWYSDGSLQVSARLPAEEGRAFLKALEAASSQIREEQRTAPEENGPAGPRDEDAPGGPLLASAATNADALSLLSESFLAHGTATRAGPDRTQLIVHVDAETLSADAFGRCELEAGPGISPETARRLGCDASLRVLIKRGKRALYLGRKTRSIPPALNLALRERDGGCRLPGCTNTRFGDGHHIVPWALGGRTDLDNLVLLCRRHHRLVHEGGFAVERTAAGALVFRNPRGERLDNSPKLPPGSPRALPFSERPLWTGSGERMDLDACVYAVAQACS